MQMIRAPGFLSLNTRETHRDVHDEGCRMSAVGRGVFAHGFLLGGALSSRVVKSSGRSGSSGSGTKDSCICLLYTSPSPRD